MQNTTEKNSVETKMTEQEFIRAKRLALIAKANPTGFRRYRVKDYERGDFRAK
jgi:hypothetical protein